MKKAQSFLEYSLMFAVMLVVAMTVYSIMHQNINVTKLTNMSKIHVKK